MPVALAGMQPRTLVKRSGRARVSYGHPLMQGMQHLWLLDAGGGKTLNDASLVASRPLIYAAGGPLWVSTPYGAGLLMSSPDYAVTSGSSVVSDLNSSTFSLALLMAVHGSSSRFACLGDTVNPGSIGLISASVSDVAFRVTNTGGTQYATSGVVFTTSAWALWVGTFDGTTIRLYQNGVLAATGTFSGTVDNAITNASLGATIAGGGPSPITAAYLIHWNRALQAAEIRDLWVDPLCFLVPQGMNRQMMLAMNQVLYGNLSASVGITPHVSRVHGAPRALSNSVGITPSITRTLGANRVVSATTAVSAPLARTLGASRALSASTATAATLGRTYGAVRALSASVAHSASVGRSQALLRGLLASVPIAANVQRTATLGRALAVSVAHVASLLGGKLPHPKTPTRVQVTSATPTKVQVNSSD